MIHLLTGLPGSGKSLSLIGIIRDFVKGGTKVFVYGVNDLDFEALGCEPWVKPFSEWSDLPKNSVLVWDEPQFSEIGVPKNKFESPPDWMKELTLHRHHGVDFVLATQKPEFLHSFVRKLVGRHTHLVRQWGLERSQRFDWNEVQVDPTKNRKKAVHDVFSFPKKDYAFYKSAEVHTVRKRIPKRLVYALVSVVLAVVLAGFGWHYAHRAGAVSAVKPEKVAAKLPEQKREGGGLLGESDRHVMTTAEYVKRLIPRMPGEPWSAPLFDRREASAEPEIYCVDLPDAGRCQCYTEQITKLNVDDAQCAKIAKDGVYNPFRKPIRELASRGTLPRDENGAPTRAPSSFYPIQEAQGLPSNAGGAPSLGASQQGARHHALNEPYHAEVFAPNTSQY